MCENHPVPNMQMLPDTRYCEVCGVPGPPAKRVKYVCTQCRVWKSGYRNTLMHRYVLLEQDGSVHLRNFRSTSVLFDHIEKSSATIVAASQAFWDRDNVILWDCRTSQVDPDKDPLMTQKIKKPKTRSGQRGQNSYKRKGVYPVSAVLPYFHDHEHNDAPPTREYDGDIMRMTGLRYRTFQAKGTTCVSCGVSGSYFAKECHQDNLRGVKTKWHFNLYAIDDNGNHHLMTKDHIIPKSMGGKDKVENMQPMCSLCNGIRGTRTSYELAELYKGSDS